MREVQVRRRWALEVVHLREQVTNLKVTSALLLPEAICVCYTEYGSADVTKGVGDQVDK